jgi:hypothetical protein
MSNFERISKDALSWEAERRKHKIPSESILNQIKHYSHRRRNGYQGLRVLAFDPETGKSTQTSIV